VKKVTLVAGLGGGTVNFSYDSVGNMTIGDGKTVTYNAFNKPLAITSGGVTSTFHYGADLSRYAQVKTGSAPSTTLYLGKLVEIEANGSKIDYRHYISDVAIQTETDTSGTVTTETNFLLRDRLGGVATIVDTSGTIVARTGYDPFGKPRDDDWDDLFVPVLPANHADTTPRGFTDHEHLDESKLIHMNGRAFDYSLGRFLSVDPFIQAPGNSQSFNPYSYIMNNPLAGIDPSGYVARDVEVDCERCNETDLADTGDSADFTVTWKETKTGSNIVTRRTSTGTASVTAKGNIHISASNGGSGSSGSARAAGTFGGGDDGGAGRAQDSIGSKGAHGAFDLRKTDEEHIQEFEASVQEHGVSSDSIYLGKDQKELKYEISGTDDFKKKVRADLNRLRRTKTGLEILRGVAESGRLVSFFATETPATTSRGAIEGHSIVGLLEKDTYAEVYFVNSTGQKGIPYFRTHYVAAHELVHVWQTSAPISPVPRIEAPVLYGRGVKDTQVQAIRYTNRIRREEGHGLIRVQAEPGGRRDLDVY